MTGILENLLYKDADNKSYRLEKMLVSTEYFIGGALVKTFSDCTPISEVLEYVNNASVPVLNPGSVFVDTVEVNKLVDIVPLISEETKSELSEHYRRAYLPTTGVMQYWTYEHIQDILDTVYNCESLDGTSTKYQFEALQMEYKRSVERAQRRFLKAEDFEPLYLNKTN